MSWQAYVDDTLMGSYKISAAAIIGLDGKMWASSAGFNLRPEERSKLASLFNSPQHAFAEGIFVSGKKYLVIKADERSIYGKQDLTGVVTVKTRQAIIIGAYPESVQPGEAVNTIERFADYLLENGY